jgi:hypothetical protein
MSRRLVGRVLGGNPTIAPVGTIRTINGVFARLVDGMPLCGPVLPPAQR